VYIVHGVFFYIVDITFIAQYSFIIYNMSMHATYYQMLQGFFMGFFIIDYEDMGSNIQLYI
jgi:hypothetical protein